MNPCHTFLFRTLVQQNKAWTVQSGSSDCVVGREAPCPIHNRSDRQPIGEPSLKWERGRKDRQIPELHGVDDGHRERQVAPREIDQRVLVGGQSSSGIVRYLEFQRHVLRFRFGGHR